MLQPNYNKAIRHGPSSLGFSYGTDNDGGVMSPSQRNCVVRCLQMEQFQNLAAIIY